MQQVEMETGKLLLLLLVVQILVMGQLEYAHLELLDQVDLE
jgi:hypothetical protein